MTHTGAPVPEGADAVVQIENTEQLSERQDGEKRVRIVKVSPAFCTQSVLKMGYGRSSQPILFDLCRCSTTCFKHAFICHMIIQP